MTVHTLLLKTTDISTSNQSTDFYPTTVTVSSNVGSLTNCRTVATFNNIDFKTLLGSDYDKHDIFNLEVVSFMTTPTDGSGNCCNNFYYAIMLDVLLSGLDWVNSGYSQYTRNNNSHAIAGIVNLQSLGNTATNYSMNQGCVIQFRKQPCATLKVNLTLPIPDATVNYTYTIPSGYFSQGTNSVFYHWGLMLKIYPASEDYHGLNIL